MGKITRILGVDTSLRSTGVGVVEARDSKLRAVSHGVIKLSAKALHSECLRQIYAGIADIIEETNPDAVSIEGVFYGKNPKTTLILGEARGTVIAVCAQRGLSVFEYAPRKVKQAVTGVGSASKSQVTQMVAKLLAMDEEPKEDAADALAMAICHLHNMSGHEALAPKEI